MMVSIIIPSYNRANVIGRSITSILNQSYQDFEIIVVDDGSTDDTHRRIMEFDDSRIRYFKSEKRNGANHARNIGIQNATGDYIAFQDSDDVWRNDKLEKQMELFQKQEHLDVIYSRYIRHLLNGEHVLIPYERFTGYLLQEGIMHTLAKLNVIGTPTMIVRKKCFDESGMFDPKLQRLQDWEINLRFAQKYQYGFVDEVLLDAYESEESITRDNEIYLDCWMFILRKHRIFFEEQKLLTQHLANLIPIAAGEKKLKNFLDIFGMECFLQSIYINEKNQKIKQDILRLNYSFVKEWITQEQESKKINCFLEQCVKDKVAVYGIGEIGQLFLNALNMDNQRKIKFVIDRNPHIKTKYKLITPETLKREDFINIQYIIISAVAHEEEIRRDLAMISEIPDVPVISLYYIIKN